MYRERDKDRDKGREKDGDKRRGAEKRKFIKKRVCRFCADKKLFVDYKNAGALQPFLTERGRLVPRRVSGNCLFHQREVTLAVKRARILALIPFTSTQLPWTP